MAFSSTNARRSGFRVQGLGFSKLMVFIVSVVVLANTTQRFKNLCLIYLLNVAILTVTTTVKGTAVAKLIDIRNVDRGS